MLSALPMVLSSYYRQVYAQTVIDTVAVGNVPTGVAVNPTTNRVYVTNEDDDTVSVIDDSLVVVLLPFRKAPAVVSGDNIYIAWWTNNTENGNEEVMFRASTDAGATFGDKINLSNTTDADSWRVEIAGEGDNVIVSWWETNQTSDIPVARISNDAGQSFGPLLRLGANGTISSTDTEATAGVATETEGA